MPARTFAIKIKSQPDDFRVDETIDLKFSPTGPYVYYRLQKSGCNTMDALRQIARAARRNPSEFAYGGKKDRHALTTQYISVKGEELPQLALKDINLIRAGFSDRAMGPDLIAGNRFTLVVRKLSSPRVESAVRRLNVVREQGMINYFDDQRFGGWTEAQGFVAEKVLKGHLSGALKAYLAAIYPDDRKAEALRKQFFVDHWKDWQACLARAGTGFERTAFSYLAAHPADFLAVLKMVPSDEMSMCLSAYQSFIWNEVVRAIVRGRSRAVMVHPGKSGEYVFPDLCPPEDQRYFSGLEIPALAAKAKMPDDISRKIYAKVLDAQGLTPNLFNRLKLRTAFFKATPRKVAVVPTDLTWRPQDDEMSPGRTKLALNFVLPRGSYGTMLLKSIFCAPRESEN